MVMTERDIFIAKLDQSRKELINAGPKHARDLRKSIHRMEKMLIEYDYTRSKAQK